MKDIPRRQHIPKQPEQNTLERQARLFGADGFLSFPRLRASSREPPGYLPKVTPRSPAAWEISNDSDANAESSIDSQVFPGFRPAPMKSQVARKTIPSHSHPPRRQTVRRGSQHLSISSTEGSPQPRRQQPKMELGRTTGTPVQHTTHTLCG
jgi:hypothetical protein